MKIDLAGKKFNMLSVIKKSDMERYKGNTTWECKCDCGNITYATTHELLSDKKKSCGCIRHKNDDLLIGKKFNLLTVIKKANFTKKADSITWECKCDCGNITYATTSELQNGHKKSCGCLKNKSNAEDLTGKRFGLLTVKKRDGTIKEGRRATWKCKCECGKTVVVRAVDLKSGNTKSCGCLHKNYAKMKRVLNKIYEEEGW